MDALSTLRWSSPYLLAITALWWLKLVHGLNPLHLDLLTLFPYLLLVLSTGLALQYQKVRFVLLSLTLLVIYYSTQHFLQRPLSQALAFYVYNVITLACAPLLLAIAAVPERGLQSPVTLVAAALLSLLLGLLIALYNEQSLYTLSDQAVYWLAVKHSDSYLLSRAASLILGLSAPLLLWLLWRPDHWLSHSLVYSAVCTYLAMMQLHQEQISVVMFTLLGAFLLFAVVRSSYDLAYRDELTGLQGRRALNQKLLSLNRNYAIAMMDIDHFKKFNDTHGHDVGDDVLRVVASHIGKVGGGGLAYRYGGEEFSVIFPGKSLEHCISHLEKVRHNIGRHKITLRDSGKRPTDKKAGRRNRGQGKKLKTVSVTISIGLAQRSEANNKPEDVIKAADRQLYRAKEQGRNCLVS